MTKNIIIKKELYLKKRQDLFAILKSRFVANGHRRKGLGWSKVQAKLEVNSEKLWSL